MHTRRRLFTQLVRHQRLFSTSLSRPADFTHAVVGAGAVGLAIARQLQSREGASVALLEKHASVGTETSSRNSEVLLTLATTIVPALSYPIR